MSPVAAPAIPSLEAARVLRTMFQDGAIRRLAVIGEAAKHVTSETRATLPELPFPQMAGMRDIVVHVYWGIDLERVWDVAVNHLDTLVAAINRLIPDDPDAAGQAS